MCSVGVVDKSMQLLKPDHEMTADKVGSHSVVNGNVWFSG